MIIKIHVFCVYDDVEYSSIATLFFKGWPPCYDAVYIVCVYILLMEPLLVGRQIRNSFLGEK